MYLMFDSVDPTQIPKTAQAVAGYVGGEWPTDSHYALRNKFPHAFVVSIATSKEQRASFLDVENGDATCDDARDWIQRGFGAGEKRPGIYADQSNMHIIEGNLHGIHRVKYRLWVAAPDGLAYARERLAEGFGACQFDWNYLGRDLDVSLCKPGFFTKNERPKYLETTESTDVSYVPGSTAAALTEANGERVQEA